MIKPWMIIGAVTFLVGSAGSLLRSQDRKWFMHLRRPRWLTFEKAIPLIWIFVFICGAVSATLVWRENPGSNYTWFLMSFYLLVEITIVAYTPLMCLSRSLIVGTVIGGVGFLLGVILTLLVFPVSNTAAFLLFPYIIWSPIGTYTTWEMSRLNPESK
ncbi:MAG: TspO/MBR family protein [Spirulinaceae cyanobacterium]